MAAKLGLNGMGDYLAGFFSPVAFIWLLYGYIQQGRQIENSEKLSKEQFDYIKTKEKNDAQPIFFISIKKIEKRDVITHLTLRIEIEKNPIFNISINTDNKCIYNRKTLNIQTPAEFIISIDNDKLDEIDRKKDLKYRYLVNGLPVYKGTPPFVSILTLPFIKSHLKKFEIFYINRLGFKSKDIITLNYSDDKFDIDISQSIQPQN